MCFLAKNERLVKFQAATFHVLKVVAKLLAEQPQLLGAVFIAHLQMYSVRRYFG